MDLATYPYSVTQIENWLDCKRMWAFRYVERREVPQKPSAALGTEIHRQLEEYVAHGAPLLYSSADPLQKKAAGIAEKALEFIPPIVVGVAHAGTLETERQFTFIGMKHKYYGKKDLTDHETHTIYDYKSTSDFKWVKTVDILRTDVQAIVYGWDELETRHLDAVPMRWIYTRTKGKPAARPVDLLLTREEAAPKFAIIEDIVDEIEVARREHKEGKWKRALDLAPTPKSCEKYGGCPWRDECKIGPMERIHAMANAGSTVTEQLLARLKAQQTQATPAGAVNPPESANSPPPPPPAPPAAPKTEDKELGACIEKAKADLAAAEPKERKARKPRLTEVNVPKNKIGTLFVNCVSYPSTGEKQFEHLLALANEKVRATDFKDAKGETYRVNDYRFVNYGHGPAVLVEAVRETLDEIGKQDELFVDASTPEGNTCLNYLTANADRVVRGTR